MTKLTAAFTLSLIGFLSFEGHTKPIIFGEDDRRDVYEVQDPKMRELAQSVAAMIPADKIIYSNDGKTATILGGTLGAAINLKEGERFFEQPSAAHCSSSLVGPDTLLTAAHCIPQNADFCRQYVYVFGYQLDTKESTGRSVSAENIYSCDRVQRIERPRLIQEGEIQQIAGPDWAVVKLKRQVKNRNILDFEENVKVGDKIFTIGFPNGLPAKITAGGVITDNSKSYEFNSDLDVFPGNSGSPVFNEGGKIIGVVVRRSPAQDYTGDAAGYMICPEGHLHPTYKNLRPLVIPKASKDQGSQVIRVNQFFDAARAAAYPVVAEPGALRLRRKPDSPEMPSPGDFIMPWERDREPKATMSPASVKP